MPVKVGKRIEPGVIPASVMQYILQCLQDICYGQVVLYMNFKIMVDNICHRL